MVAAIPADGDTTMMTTSGPPEGMVHQVHKMTTTTMDKLRTISHNSSSTASMADSKSQVGTVKSTILADLDKSKLEDTEEMTTKGMKDLLMVLLLLRIAMALLETSMDRLKTAMARRRVVRSPLRTATARLRIATDWTTAMAGPAT